MNTINVPQRWPGRMIPLAVLLFTMAGGVIAGCMSRQAGSPTGFDVRGDMSPLTLSEGRQIFRFDTFGDEQFWTDTARMHEVVQKSVSPTTALSVGLKVDAEAIPAALAQAIKAGQVDLNSPATTVALLKLNAVNNGVLHAPSETGMDAAYAMRTANKRYRTTPLRGLWQHPPYFHDGSATTLEAVVEHYNRVRGLGLDTRQKSDLVQYLKSI